MNTCRMFLFFYCRRHRSNLAIDTTVVAGIVDAHITACRKIPALAHAWAIIIPESNLPHIAEGLRESLKDEYKVPRMVFMMEDGHGQGKRRVFDLPGSMTTERNKREAVDILRDQYLRPEQICFNDPFIWVYPDVRIVPDVKLEIMDHLRNFKKKLLPRKERTTAEISEVTYTGKLSGNKNDDFVSALLIAVYNKREFWKEANRAKYGTYWGFGEQ